MFVWMYSSYGVFRHVTHTFCVSAYLALSCICRGEVTELPQGECVCVCERYRESKGIPFRVKSLILARWRCEGEASRGEKRVRRRLNWIGGKVGEGRGGRSPAGRMLSFFH